MKIGLGSAFVLALLFHGALLATLVVNVSLEKPKKPEEKLGQIMHATIVNVPPAKGSPEGQPPKKVQVQDTAKQAAEAAAKAKAAAEAKKKAELEKQLAAQKKAEAERQKALALKKAQEEKKKAEEEAKKKAEEEAKKKAAEEAKKKAEEEAKKKAELEAIAKQMAAEQAARMEAQKLEQLKEQADDLESDLLGQAHGVDGGEGLGSGTGSSDSLTYGNKVQQLIEQNWRIDPSMNGKRVVVTVSVDNEGMIYNEKCQGDNAVCASAIATLNLIGMLPRPPQGCKDCNTIVITMIPKI